MTIQPRASPKPLRFAGWAARFDRIDRAGDVIRRGAFGTAGMLPLLWCHRGPVIGHIAFTEDEEGLRVLGEVEDRSAAAMVRAGTVDGLSVGYRPLSVRHGAWREILRAELVEISLVAQPMQPGARVTEVMDTR